jgi:predicted transcriptional regulator of viral defense system
VAGRIQRELWEIAVDQYGYVTSKDARGLGINPVELGKLAARGQIEHVSYGVYRFAQLPIAPLDSYMLATLWANGHGVLSHDTALDLHDLCDINPSKLHITVPGRRPERRGGELYVVHSGPLADDEVTWHEGIRIVTIAKAIEQGIGSGVSSHLLTQALLTARDRGATTAAEHRRLVGGLEARS